MNGDDLVVPVSMGGDWVASSLAAGVMNTASGNSSFGNGGDLAIVPGRPGITSRIANVVIGGQVAGTPSEANAGDHFGVCAHQVGGLSVGGVAPPLGAGTNIELPPVTGGSPSARCG